MPTYLYKCQTCGNEFTYEQKISEPALTHCPAEICPSLEKGKGLVMRKISKNVSFVFNGNGFYLTDYVHKKEKSAENTCNTADSSCPACVSNVSKNVA